MFNTELVSNFKEGKLQVLNNPLYESILQSLKIKLVEHSKIIFKTMTS